MSEILEKNERLCLRRAHQRGHYDLKTIPAILNTQPLCHIGYVVDASPVVMPSIQWRV